ncbi:sugar/nucleoside kinase (ribokinase family) [Curtobacterium sp. AG1037]|uniref:carbohydrate kinase family protein n=1 Tax=Curtobacterium sp. AG1037 TaxID=2183990 RepID=UPI000E0C7823|nr:PfkB family carbohydrate kinase [Curtobacterium sp. AG1037]RDH96127.1 sugar/nucleoside kinase (ribokinase family) [Curtobacterium sp. AG1037]
MHDRTHRSTDAGVLVAGQLFFDAVFADLPQAPVPGQEVWTPHFGWTPGGIANFAIAAARLGASTDVCAAVGDDDLSGLCRAALVREGIGTALLREVAGWALPVSACIDHDGDRAIVTGGTPAPLALPDLLPPTGGRVAALHVDASTAEWVRGSADRGLRVFADVGWDPTGAWDPALLDAIDGAYAFTPNAHEALAYTRTDDPVRAARLLAERVPLAVVTLGADGVVAVDSSTGEQVVVPPVRVRAVDSTGAGDVFCAALAVGTLAELPLRERIDLAALVAAITVSRPGGAAGAPRRAELAPWLAANPAAADPDRYGFVTTSLPSVLAGPAIRTP